jgi:O-succinylbenzoic acid--CoA ligase
VHVAPYPTGVPRLVPLVATGDREFVDALRRTWDAGDAVLPVDPRLPAAATDAVRTAMRAGDDVDDGDALVMATSGSTGEPKGVVLTHDAVAAAVRMGNAALDVDPSSDRWLACLPLAHMGGLNVVLRAVLSGTPLELLRSFDAAAVTRSDATLTSLVPTALARLDAGAVARWRRILLGGSAPPPSLPPNVVPTYGLTETCGGCVYAGVPFAGVDVRVDPATAEIHLRGPLLLRCYRDGTDPKTADGWFATGDAGRLDDDGTLHVDGRLTDLIVTGGENVWPVAVERSLRTHRAIADCVVAGRRDPEWGECVVAWVVVHDGDDPPSLDEVRDHVKADLAPWCAPRELHVVDDLPRTPSGKVRRPTNSA